MRVLVTGGTGVVGTGAVTELLVRGHSVVLMSRHAKDDARQWSEGVTPRNGDVSDPASLTGAADGCDAVLHVVGIVEEHGEATFQRVNVDGTRNIVAEAERAGVGRLVYVSSLGADTGESAYHKSKHEGELVVAQFTGNWTICRPGNVYGPGDEQISMMLRMVRSPSPIIPKVGDGDQPFQPLWWEDCAQALAECVERDDLAEQTLELAGEEVTCQNDLHRRLSEITGRSIHSIPVPEFLATLGAKAVSMIGWDISFNDSERTMLGEGNVIRAGGVNGLTQTLGITPTPLDVGLRALAKQQPTQLPEKGIGALTRKRYWADIRGSALDADAMFQDFRMHFNDVTPVFVDVGSEPHAADEISEGESLTLALPMRGHVQVRVCGLESRSATLLTLEGHPLAGAVRFTAEPRPGAVRFQAEVFDRPATLLDFIAMRTIGDRMQEHTWSQVVERMVKRSGGTSSAGVEHAAESVEQAEADAIGEWLEGLALEQKRDENDARVRAG